MKKICCIMPRTQTKEAAELSEKVLSEVTMGMGRDFELHLVQGMFPIPGKKITCRCVTHPVRTLRGNSLPLHLITQFLYMLGTILIGIRIVRKEGIDYVLSIQGLTYLGLSAFLIGKVTGRPVIQRIQESCTFKLKVLTGFSQKRLISKFSKMIETVERFLIRHSDIILVTAPHRYEQVVRIRGDENVFFIPQGVDIRTFRPGKGKPGKRILFVGRLDRIKGIDTLLRAFGDVIKKHRDAELVVIGDGKLKGKYEDLAKRLGIEKKVIFRGFVPHSKLPSFYRSASVFVCSSLLEEFPNTVLEAMACRKPVVATDVGGMSIMINNKKTGLLVKENDAKALSRSIGFLLTNPQVGQMFGKRGRQRILEMGWDQKTCTRKNLSFLNVLQG